MLKMELMLTQLSTKLKLKLSLAKVNLYYWAQVNNWLAFDVFGASQTQIDPRI